jgi:DNA repair photolyase
MPADADFTYPDALPPSLGANGAHRRAAGLNPANRFEHLRTFVLGEALDEALREREAEAAEEGRSPTRPRTVPLEVFRDTTRTIINTVAPEADMPFGFTVNPYRGCEHGCIYCYARTHHEYLGFSCGLDFETKIMAKPDAPALLRRELALPKWKGDPIVMSAITDVYQPIEKEMRLTRQCLEIMESCGQPVATMTKNTLALRDLDLWQSLARRKAAQVIVTLVTLDPKLAGILEPRASPPMARLRIIREMARAGVPVGVNIAPVIPGLTDKEIPAILEAAKEAGAQSAIWILLRLPYQLKELFEDWLRRHFPDRADHVLSLLRQSYGGKLYDAEEARRGGGDGPYAAQIGQLFRVFCAKHGLNRHGLNALSSENFRKPGRGGEMSLFG